MIQRIHPRFLELRDQFRNHPEWFTPWSGTLFRFQTLDFPASRDVLNGKGAAYRGGRWNPAGLPAVYGSTSDTTALAECKSTDHYYGVITKTPRILVAIEADLTRMLDLTDPAIRRVMDLTLTELAAEDWRKLQAAGKESLTQSIGRAVAETGGSGLMARSAAVRHGVNVAVFPNACSADRMTVVKGDLLDKIGTRSKT